MLREMGPKKFINEVIYEEDVPARKLLNAFGCDLPAFLEDSPDENMYTYLNYAMVRELKRRPKQDKYNTIEDAVDLLLKSKNIIVLTGAGISTSLGIPDFRSKNGLYALLGDRQDIDDPQDVFDIEVFREEPHIFFEVAGKIVPKVEDHRYTPTHKFIKLLEDKGKLLTNYTQNIDNIESYAGISPSKIIQCHGSFATATCMVNKNHKVKGEEIFPTMREGEIPYCKQCEVELATQQPKKKRRSRHSNGKRKKRAEYEDSSDDEGQFDVPTPGIMKPDITFFREALPDTFSNRLVDHDRKKVDLVIVIGTSMKVAPVSDVVDFLHNVPTIYISREPVKHIYFDIDLIGDCDVVVAELCRRAKWKLEHEMIPKNQVVKVWSGGKHFPSRWYFKEKSEPYQAGIKKPSISEDEATVEAKIEEVVKREKVKSEKMKNGTNERKASSTKRIKYEFDSDEERESYNAAKAKAKALAAVKREVASDEESL